MKKLNDYKLSVPAAFWHSLTESEFQSIARGDGLLTPPLVERLWRLSERQGECPPGIEIVLDGKKLLKVIRASIEQVGSARIVQP